MLRLRRGLEDWIFQQGKAARRENPEADALWCMCHCCSTILWLRRNRRCTRARAAGSLLPSLAAAAVWEKKCEPQQFNDIRALILLQMRAFWSRRRKKQKTQHVCTRGLVTPSITLVLHARGDADMKSWEELVNDGWSMWDWCGGCAAGTETKEKDFATDSPDGKIHGRWGS